MKAINIKGIIILVAVLLAIQLGVGMVLSPLVGKIVVKSINRASDTKISVGSVNVWPLTLSFTLKDLKVFDPDDVSKKMVGVKTANFRLSPLALLSKRIVVSSVGMRGVEVDLEGEPDGSFNIAKIAEGKEEKKEEKPSFFERARGEKDLFARLFNMVKERNLQASSEKAAEKRRKARRVTAEVQKLPEGRRVVFKTRRDEYLAEIRDLSVNDASIKVSSDGGQINIEKADLVMKGIAVDPVKGAMFDALRLSGVLKKGDREAGSLKMSYRTDIVREAAVTKIDFTARNVDMSAVRFIYEDSLPVDVRKGILDISSDTRVRNEELLSENKITLSSFELQPGSGKSMMVGVIPMPALCEALNQVDPLKLNFKITGTVNDPKFSGLEETVKEVAKPYLKNIEKQAVGKLTGFLEKKAGAETSETGSSEDGDGSAAKQAVDSIKSLFGK
ncbi:MAG: hypothetical protein GF408_02670 [Candidatus Omnitrophica bacterium]|nr:hypothetical protein [Candidatus Omnitrophota bacterium]